MIINILLSSLLISLLINGFFFVFAYVFRTDKLTDFSYGLSFILLTLITLPRNPNISNIQIALTVAIVVWGIRLISYLLIRILKIKKDDRFEDKRNSLTKFGGFFLFQAIAVFVIMIPSTMILSKTKTSEFNFLSLAGLIIWASALTLETVADIQKFRFKNKKENKGKFISSGVWRYSRHPNYFGEMMCWWGLWILALPYLQGLEHLSIVGPMFITYILMFVSGIPILEKRYVEKYKNNKEYQKYKKHTSLLIPLPPSK